MLGADVQFKTDAVDRDLDETEGYFGYSGRNNGLVMMGATEENG